MGRRVSPWSTPSRRIGRKNTSSAIWPIPRGILQADGYKGYAKLYEPERDSPPRLREAACWAHLRRDFHDEWSKTKSAIAREALDRIGGLYDIEREISGRSADTRLAARQRYSVPKVEAFFAWSESQLALIPGKGDLAKAFRYGISRRAAFSLFLEDGRVAIDNNPAERALRPIGIGRKNWLFAGADTGAETLARAMTVIETASTALPFRKAIPEIRRIKYPLSSS
nr:IS66 family transposase [Roseicitreum antarcticum]